MRFTDINGKEVKYNLSSSDYPLRAESECKSKLQYRCGQVLKEIFPRLTILEEFVIPASKLKIDFFIPQLMIAVEVQGGQHYKYNTFFHKNRQDFRKGIQRDVSKSDWCEMNNIELIYVEDDADVTRNIIERYKTK